MESYSLGLDIGTSKVAAVLVACDTGAGTATEAVVHAATVPGCPRGHDEQDVETLLASVGRATGLLAPDARARTVAVGLTGQMHGVVAVDRRLNPVTNLITWQDQRCNEAGFLEDIQRRSGDRSLRTGFGTATLAWLSRRGQLPDQAEATATIHDLVAARLCALPRPVTDPTDAASWGLFDPTAGRWDGAAADRVGLDPRLLPEIRDSGSMAGMLSPTAAAELGLPADIPVMVPLGDNQASLWATLAGRDPGSALALTLGTGGQLSAVMPAGFVPPPESPATFEYRPYPGGRLAAVAACLCGGSAFAWFATTIGSWCREIGLEPPDQDVLYERLIQAGLAADGGGLDIVPRFLGERHEPDGRGAIRRIGTENCTVGNVSRALVDGILRNLRDMLAPECLQGRSVVVGSGNAIRRSKLMQTRIEAEIGLPLHLCSTAEEAATGAALLARDLVLGAQASGGHCCESHS